MTNFCDLPIFSRSWFAALLLMTMTAACGDGCRGSTGSEHAREVTLTAEQVAQSQEEFPDRVEVELPDFWTTDGRVMAIAEDESRVYVGGRFDHVFPYRGNLFGLGHEAGGKGPTMDKIHGLVRVVIPDGAGGWFVGGDFRKAGKHRRLGLARLGADGAVDPDFDVPVDGSVSALALAGDVLYLGGAFQKIGDEERRYVAAIDIKARTVRDWSPEIDGPVIALAATDDVVYLGGAFQRVGESRRLRLAAVTAETGQATPWEPEVMGNVHALLLAEDTLYVGGSFRAINEAERSNLAAFDKETGALHDFDPVVGDVSGAVDVLAVDGERLLVGGAFTSVAGATRTHLAALELSSGRLLDWNPAPDGRVLAIALVDEHLYVGGDFVTLGGEARPRIGQLDRSTGEVRPWTAPVEIDPSTRIFSLAVSKDRVLAGGEFGNAEKVVRNNLAAFDKNTGVVVDWNPGADGIVNALERIGDALYVAGGFEKIAGGDGAHLARLDAATGELQRWNPRASGEVYSMTFDGSTVYVTGDFRSIGGVARRGLAALDVASGEARPFDAHADGPVVAVVVDNETLFVGGGFEQIGGASVSYLAALDKESGEARQWSPRVGRGKAAWIEFLGVSALAVDDDVVYVGGVFGQVGDEIRWSLAAIDKQSGAVRDWNPMAHGTVMAMAMTDELLYVSGDFGRVGGQNRPALAALDKKTGRATAWNPMATPWVSHLQVSGNRTSGERIYAGGALVYIDGQLRQGFGVIPASTPHLPAAAPQPGGAEFSWRDAFSTGPEEANAALGHYTVAHGCTPARRLPGLNPEGRQFWMHGAPFCYYEKERAPHHPLYRIRAIMYSEEKAVAVQLEPRETMAFDATVVEKLGLPELPHVFRQASVPLAPTGRNVLSFRAAHYEGEPGEILGYDLFAKPQAPGELGFVRIYAFNGWPPVAEITEVVGAAAVSEEMVLPGSFSMLSPHYAAYAELSLNEVRLGAAPVYPSTKSAGQERDALRNIDRLRFFGDPALREEAMATMFEALRKEAALQGREMEPMMDIAAEQTSSATVLTGLLEVAASQGIEHFFLLGRYLESLDKPFSAYGNVNAISLEFAPRVRSAGQPAWAPSQIRLTATLSPRGIAVRGQGTAIRPVDGCPADGPTICLLDPSADVAALVEKARAEQKAGRFAAADGLLRQAIGAYDWARFYGLLGMVKEQYPEERTLHFIAEDDVALAIVVRAMDVARHRLRVRGTSGQCQKGFENNAALESAVLCVERREEEAVFVPLFDRHVWSWSF